MNGKLQQKHDKPFFLVAGFWRPHVPMYAPQKWHDLFPLDKIQLPKVLANDRADLPVYAKDLTNGEPAPRHEFFLEGNNWKSAVQSYLASIAFVDSQVGRVLDALDASPYTHNTIIVLFSDHGWHLGEKERWARSLWRDSTRVPLIISAPYRPKGQTCNRPVGLIDIYPTLLGLTGSLSKIHLEGQNLLHYLHDPDLPSYRPAITTFGPGNHSLHFLHHHYIRYNDGSEELYDLRKDPHEWHNLAGQPIEAKRISALRQHLPKTNAPPVRTKWWNRWEIANWEKAKKNAKR